MVWENTKLLQHTERNDDYTNHPRSDEPERVVLHEAPSLLSLLSLLLFNTPGINAVRFESAVRILFDCHQGRPAARIPAGSPISEPCLFYLFRALSSLSLLGAPYRNGSNSVTTSALNVFLSTPVGRRDRSGGRRSLYARVREQRAAVFACSGRANGFVSRRAHRCEATLPATPHPLKLLTHDGGGDRMWPLSRCCNGVLKKQTNKQTKTARVWCGCLSCQ